jgi:ribosomal protein S12 methylthiotransferase
MRRETSQQYIIDLIKRIRAGIPGIALRTTFIVGFPGETEESFKTLLDFVRETKFERLGVFTYSQEDGTRAGAMAGQISDKVKKKRRELVMAAQHKIAKQVSESFVGREIKVLVEGVANEKQLQSANVSSWEHGLMRTESSAGVPPAPGNAGKNETQNLGRRDACPTLVARGEADAPDIDGRIYIRGKLPVGEFSKVKIIGHTDYDLIAEPV